MERSAADDRGRALGDLLRGPDHRPGRVHGPRPGPRPGPHVQGVRAAQVPRPAPGPGLHPRAAAPGGVGLRLLRRHPHGRRPRPAAARQARAGARAADRHGAQRRVPVRPAAPARRPDERPRTAAPVAPVRRPAGATTLAYPGARRAGKPGRHAPRPTRGGPCPPRPPRAPGHPPGDRAVLPDRTRTTSATSLDVLRTEKAGGALLLRRRRRGPGLGQLAVGGRLRPAPPDRRRPGSAAPGPHARPLGAPTACSPCSSSSSASSSSGRSWPASCAARRAPCCRSSPRSAGWRCPAVLYLLVNLTGGHLRGWAVPTATDIAFAIAVLAVVGRSLPNSLRAFLLTLAVVDDLLAIIVIAAVYSESIDVGWLAARWRGRRRSGCSPGAGSPPRGCSSRWAWRAWAFMHASGVHATIAGVRARPGGPGDPGRQRGALPGRAHRAPVAADLRRVSRCRSSRCSPPGSRSTGEALLAAAKDPVAQGVVLGLVLGKPLGIVGRHLAGRHGSPGPRWPAAWAGGTSSAVGFVAGIGFTVSLLVGSLAFGEGTATEEHVRAAILVASLARRAARRRRASPCATGTTPRSRRPA